MKKRRNGYFTLIQASNAFGGWTAIPSEKLSWNVKVIKGVEANSAEPDVSSFSRNIDN